MKIVEIGGSSILDHAYNDDITKIYRNREPQHKAEDSFQMDIVTDLRSWNHAMAYKLTLDQEIGKRISKLFNVLESADLIIISSGGLTNNISKGILDNYDVHRDTLDSNYRIVYEVVSRVLNSRFVGTNLKDSIGKEFLKDLRGKGTESLPTNHLKLNKLKSNLEHPVAIVYLGSVATEFGYPTRPNYYSYKVMVESLFESVVDMRTLLHPDYRDNVGLYNVQLPQTVTRMCKEGEDATRINTYLRDVVGQLYLLNEFIRAESIPKVGLPTFQALTSVRNQSRLILSKKLEDMTLTFNSESIEIHKKQFNIE